MIHRYLPLIAYEILSGDMLTSPALRNGDFWGFNFLTGTVGFFLNAVAMMLCSKVWAADAGTISKLTELDLGECEGIIIAKTDSSCTLTHKTVRPHEFWQ